MYIDVFNVSDVLTFANRVKYKSPIIVFRHVTTTNMNRCKPLLNHNITMCRHGKVSLGMTW